MESKKAKELGEAGAQESFGNDEAEKPQCMRCKGDETDCSTVMLVRTRSKAAAELGGVYGLWSQKSKIVKAWPLLAWCLDTGAVICLLMESMKTKSVLNALLQLQLLVGQIERLFMDQGTNMFELKQMVEVSNSSLQVKEVRIQPVDGQFRNYSERSVQSIKRSYA